MSLVTSYDPYLIALSLLSYVHQDPSSSDEFLDNISC